MNRKPKLLIIGHARHGKDTFAEILVKLLNLSFVSSSEFVAKEIIWPFWGKERYSDYSAFFEDRMNNRTLWSNLISAYNTPDKTKTVSTMFDRDNHDLYVGMRKRDELEACKKANKFDKVIWIDACDRLPKEGSKSMELSQFDADIFVDNNHRDADLMPTALKIQEELFNEGFNVNWPETMDKLEAELQKPEKTNRLTWLDAPDGSSQVLDHGFIRVEDIYGDDSKICEAARMSYGRGTKSVNKDEGLIRYLVTNHHTSPLEMASIKFHMRLPIFVMRQLVRHRTAKLNEYSGRYSEMVRLFYTPRIKQICVQDKVNKQGSAEQLPDYHADVAHDIINKISNKSFDTYEELLKLNVSRETARIILPLNTYTEVVWQMDISNLLKFLYLRDDSHAQWEIREYAKQISKVVELNFPSVYKAYIRVRDSVTLTQEQLESLLTGTLQNPLPKGEEKVVNDLKQQFGV